MFAKTFVRLGPAFLILLLLILLTPPAKAGEWTAELNLGGGYQGNLFGDSLAEADSYSSLAADLQYYPSSKMQLSFYGAYNGYIGTEGLSNLAGGVSATLIPTKAESPVSMMLSGEYYRRSFGELFSLYDRSHAGGSALLAWQVAEPLVVKSGLSYSDVDYINSDYGSNRGLEGVAGFNVTPFGSNAFNIEIALSQREYDQLILDDEPSGQGRRGSNEKSLEFTRTSYSFRYSRPLGQRTGLSGSFVYSRLQDKAALAVPGYSIDYLSPWADLWDGSGVSLTLKHFFPAQFKFEMAAGMYDKDYVDAVESLDGGSDTYTVLSREDRQTSVQVTISRPFSSGRNNLLVPKLNVGYRHNESSQDLYDYGSFALAFALDIRL